MDRIESLNVIIEFNNCPGMKRMDHVFNLKFKQLFFIPIFLEEILRSIISNLDQALDQRITYQSYWYRECNQDRRKNDNIQMGILRLRRCAEFLMRRCSISLLTVK